ncbi:unnamed protein product [Calicophoron daubneyi]|uniref:SCP domain-containing protein n=1 Tax=Calicophoron daubneyi TaxID=300641 RepID=A0AAV2TQ31_CALDB
MAGSLDARKKELQEFAQAVTDAHNELRQKHGSPALTLDQALCDLAQQWANHLAGEPKLANSGYTYQGVRLGENLFARTSNAQPQLDSKELLNHWYQEKAKYKFDQEPASVTGIGGFTQVIWAGSKGLGVGKATKTTGSGKSASCRLVVVCLYNPPGNVKGEFVANVKPEA